MKKLALISTLTLLLTACGGGGGSASTAGNASPTAGVAKYDSQVAVMNKNNHKMSRLAITTNFANKKLSSPVIPGTDIRLDSDITGNTFEAPDSNPAMVKGRFFGTNASEIGGAFEDDEIIGAFHGVKQ